MRRVTLQGVIETEDTNDMATFRYFAGTEQLTAVQHDGSPFISAIHFSGLNTNGRRVAVERMIERKPNPSMHKCDARCLNATGFKCECSCGGKNHGAGSFTCMAVAA
jgi:hypothetical protein